MSCKYGDRGALTAICTNANSHYFRITAYRFDYLDETLLCLNCTLDSLDAGTFDISGNQIKTLMIRNSSITSIHPKAFMGMIYMTHLFLSDNPIDNIFPGAFAGIRKVKYLELENAVHKLEPEVFRELFMLDTLMLSHNKLSEIKPGTFDGLHSLKLLDLSWNFLKTVNNSFDQLVNLLDLRLNDNLIQRIQGDEFNNLRSLLVLKLDSNHMTNFSINMGPDNHLRSLLLASNQLSSSSFKARAFENLTNVENLDLSGNDFKNLTTNFFHGLFRITSLDLSGNRFKNISTGAFTGLPHLMSLNLSDNQLVSLNITGRLQLHALHTLDVSRNEIESFDYISLITKAPRLRNVNLDDNHLSCKLSNELETLLEEDNIYFKISNSDPVQVDCPRTTESYNELMRTFTEETVRSNGNSTILVWMFVLITLVILLVGVLFYVQFFILLRMNSGSYSNIRIMSNLRLSQTENV
ncbi:hypothetical protein JTB14_024052 [Gonioctena quinquepunctata]|nr:hypothetical protein JTB14_024052 [Gonioctena quinquepunctata]